MPCNTTISNKVQWKASTDINIIKEVFAGMGLKVQEIGGVIVGIEQKTGLSYRICGYNPTTHEFINYQAPASAGRVDEREVKRSYSEIGMVKRASAMGWVPKKVGPNQYQLVKRF